MYACDEGTVLLQALQKAGRNLTPATLVTALESIKNVPMARYANVSFSSTRHDGAEQQRTLRFQASCSCWKVVTPLGPVFVP
jgi:hypothetical protein